MAKTDGLIVRVSGAAEILGVSPRTVRRWASSGELPPLDKGDGRVGSYVFETGMVRRKAAERQRRRAS